MRRAPSFLLLVALLGANVSAHAEPAPSADRSAAEVEEARRRFQRGVELYREGSFDAALAEFNKAYQLAPNYRLLYNLGQVQSERHDFVAAQKFFEQYLEDGADEISSERRVQVERELAALRGKIAELSVRANVADAELFVDGVPMGRLPLQKPLLVNAGVHQLQIRKDGYETGTRQLTIAGGEVTRVEFALRADSSKRVAKPSAAAGEAASSNLSQSSAPVESGRGPGLWISLVATGVFAGGAATFAVLTRKSDQKLDDELDRFPGNKNRIDDARSELQRNAALTDGLTAAAVVAAGFSVYFALSGPSSSETRSGSVRRGLRVAPTGRGVHVLGHF
jgi:hypothetical protein